MPTVMPLHPPPALPFDPARPAADRSRSILAALPEPLRDLLAAGRTLRRSRFAEDGFDGVAESWAAPAGVTASQAAMARRALDELERTVLAPADPGHLLARVLALLSHFPAKAVSPEVERMIALDWAEDLGEFPAWAVDEAARGWRRTRKWRPSIAELRAACAAACAGERELAARLRTVAQSAGQAAEPAEPAAALHRMAGRALRRMA